MILSIFLALKLVSSVVIKELVNSPLDGPCIGSTAATLNKNHINLGDTNIDQMDKLMIYGWFMIDQATTTTKNLVYIIPNSDNSYSQHLLAVSLNSIAIASTCISDTQCVTITIDTIEPLYYLFYKHF